MTLSVTAFPAGPIDTNSFLVIDEESHDALIVDAPPDVADAILLGAKRAGATIRIVVITHPHWDHIGDAAALQARTGAPLAAHPGAVPRLTKPASALMQLPIVIAPANPDRMLDEGDRVALGHHEFVVLFLPGHEPSHIALYSEADRVFLGGDVLFPNGHGRVDIPGADPEVMANSLTRLAPLPPDVVVYPGHGATTTIGAESWLQEFRSLS